MRWLRRWGLLRFYEKQQYTTLCRRWILQSKQAVPCRLRWLGHCSQKQKRGNKRTGYTMCLYWRWIHDNKIRQREYSFYYIFLYTVITHRGTFCFWEQWPNQRILHGAACLDYRIHLLHKVQAQLILIWFVIYWHGIPGIKFDFVK